MINKNGERFCNEIGTWEDITMKMEEQNKIIRKYCDNCDKIVHDTEKNNGNI